MAAVMLKGGKARIKFFLKKVVEKISDRLDPNDLLEVLTETLKGLSPEIIRGLLRALQNLERPLHVGAEVAIMGISREQRERAIYNLVFEKIKDIVSKTDSTEYSPEKIADHQLVVDGQQRALSDVILKDFDFPMVFNLIHTIHNKWNVDEHGKIKSFDEDPNPKALFAIKELMNILINIEQTDAGSDLNRLTTKKIVGLSQDTTINEFFCNCFRGIENYTLDKDYYNFVVQGIERCYIDSEEKKRWQAY